MFFRSIILIFIFLFSSDISFSKWLEISNLQIKKEMIEQGGANIIIEYDINDPGISSDTPAYVFVRFSKTSGKEWCLLPMNYLRGNGYDIVDSPGHKRIVWWGPIEVGLSNLDDLKFKVYAMKMIKIPDGEFVMKAIPGAGYVGSKNQDHVKKIPTYYIAKYETTTSMYVDYLNEVGSDGTGWNKRMSDNLRCGIAQNGTPPNFTYSVISGREKFPIVYVSWYDALSFLDWCGLQLPTEAEWEKAFRGGVFLDGDEKKQKSNPLPERKYPWGNESPNEGGIYRCNYDGADDGFENTAPVGSYEKFNSPNGVSDMAGNVAEWTFDWYTTTYHVGLDGFRVVRGGSWMAVPVECDAITGATSLPLKESSIMGFRGVK